jgi:hypothetical protein
LLGTKLNISSYILLGESAWLSESVRSYYPFVDEIVAVYDAGFRSFTGHNIKARYEHCISVLNAIDTDRKVKFVSSDFVAQTNDLMAADTYMRQYALNSVSSRAELVIQIDGDEILPDPSHFLRCIEKFVDSEFMGMEYSARWLFTHIAASFYLERCNRDFSYWHAIPGPVVVRPNQLLNHSRQISSPCMRFEPGGSHAKMELKQALLHPSMLRSDSSIREKMEFLSGHANQIRGNQIYQDWTFAKKNPYLFCLWSKLLRKSEIYRPVNLSYASHLLDAGLKKYYYV